MKVIKKEDLITEVNKAIANVEFVAGTGKTSGKPYKAFQITGKNGKSILLFARANDILRLGVVVDDIE